MVPLLIILTVVVFAFVDLGLRLAIKRADRKKVERARKAALESSLTIDFTHEAISLKRVAVDNPRARILAVDDEEIVLDSFRKILAIEGFAIDTVERGKEALGLIQRNDYDFVFVDLKMPGMDGVEVTKGVKHLRPDIDVIVITGYASVESAVETMKYGAMDYVQKPFTEEELIAFVNKTLIRRQDRIERLTKPLVHLVTPARLADESKRVINVPAGVFVGASHCWVSLELNGAARVGLDDFALKVLGPLESIDFPRQGQKVTAGQPLFNIRKDGRHLTLPSPVSGKVSNINTGLAEHLDYLQMKPYELGWICTMEPSNLPQDLHALVLGSDSLRWYKREIDVFNEALNELARKKPDGESAEAEKKRLDLLAWQAFERCCMHS